MCTPKAARYSMKRAMGFSLFWKIYLTLLLTLFLPMILFNLRHIARVLQDKDGGEPRGIFKHLEWDAREMAERAEPIPDEGLPLWLEETRNSSDLETILVERNRESFSTGRLEHLSQLERLEDEAPFRPGRLMTASAFSGSGRTRAVIALSSHRPGEFQKFNFITDQLLLACLCVLFSFLLVRNFMTPLSKLQTITQKLADGDFSVRADQSVTGRSDEIAALGRSFNAMADRVENLVSSQKRLLRDISHEIRSPLQRVDVAVALLKQDSRPAWEKYLNRVELEVGRIDSMVEELLTLTRAEERSLMNLGPVSLGDTLRSIIEDAVFECGPEGKSVTMDTNIPPSQLTVAGDALLLKRALDNVVRNAIRYTTPGTRVEIGVSREGAEKFGCFVITIRDHGPGVPKDELEKIFLPYYRTDQSRERSQGSVGLGLSISRRIVESHGGEIFARSAPGGGLLVTIRLKG